MVLRSASFLVVLAVVGCGGGAGGAATPASTPTRIPVTLNDQLRIEPAQLSAHAGHQVTFVVTNAGAIAHEFYIGDESQQAARDQEVLNSGGAIQDGPNGVGVEPGQTEELTFTFPAAGTSIAGCHVPGHYAAGMKANIAVQ